MTGFLPTLVVIAVFGLDRLTKYGVKAKMFYGETREIFPGFNLTYVENTGAAFGMGQNKNGYFIAIAVTILIALFILARKAGPANVKMKAAFAAIVGGALGNLYDRIAQGSVTDFLDFY